MAKLGPVEVEVEVKVVGDLGPLLQAFGLMSDALAAYGHRFDDDEMAALDRAAEILAGKTGQVVPLEVDPSTVLAALP